MDEYMRGNKCIRPNKKLLLQRKGILEKGLTLFDLNNLLARTSHEVRLCPPTAFCVSAISLIQCVIFSSSDSYFPLNFTFN